MIKIKQLEPVFSSVFHKDFRELIAFSAKAYKGDNAFIIKHKVKKEVSYEYITFEGLKENVEAFGTGLLKKGFKGKRIALIGKNRYEWMVGYFATLCGLGISIPLDKGLPFDEAESSLERSYADVVIFDKDHLELVNQIKENGQTQVSTFICMDEIPGFPSVSQIMEEGRQAISEGFHEYLTLPIDSKASTILLFTSGTTSMSKAVMLSQENITSNIYAMQQTEPIGHGDVNMAFLPYHHTFGSTGQVLMIACGVTTAFCDGLKYLQKNIVEYKVSVFVCVPLLIESIYKKIMVNIKKQGKEKTVKTGLMLSKILLKFGIDKRRKIFKEILDQLGGDIRYVISGASAIDPIALEGFNAFGIDAVQGYGMTEASPVLSAENPQNRSSGSIGRAMLGVDLRIVDENEEGIGELIARGPNIMAGYFENQEETDKVLIDGWLHTGDLAFVDKKGFPHICGRKKNVIVLKNGKNIYPEELEILISNLPYVVENMIFGQPRHKDGDHKDLAICAKIVYDKEYMHENYGVSSSEEIQAVIKKDLDIINDELPTYKHILRLVATDQPMIKTTTGKVKRFEEMAKN